MSKWKKAYLITNCSLLVAKSIIWTTFQWQQLKFFDMPKFWIDCLIFLWVYSKFGTSIENHLPMKFLKLPQHFLLKSITPWLEPLNVITFGIFKCNKSISNLFSHVWLLGMVYRYFLLFNFWYTSPIDCLGWAYYEE